MGKEWIVPDEDLGCDGAYYSYTEVVRCKDCKHRDPEDNKCDSGALERAGCIFPVQDDYFCAWGERKKPIATTENRTLEEIIDLYIYGDSETPPHAFDFTIQDAETMKSCVAFVRRFANQAYPHNFQGERYDIREYCHRMTAFQNMAKDIIANGTRNHPTEPNNR